MRALAALGSAALIGSLVSMAPAAWAGGYNRAAYLGQAKRTGVAREAKARDFLVEAADKPLQAINGPAGGTITAWIENATEPCTPPGTTVELTCRMRGLVDSARVEYALSKDGTRQWAALFLHTSPDSGNAGANHIMV